MFVRKLSFLTVTLVAVFGFCVIPDLFDSEPNSLGGGSYDYGLVPCFVVMLGCALLYEIVMLGHMFWLGRKCKSTKEAATCLLVGFGAIILIFFSLLYELR